MRSSLWMMSAALVAMATCAATGQEAKIGEQAPPMPARSWNGNNDVDNILDGYREHVVALFFFRDDDAARLKRSRC